MNNINIKIKKLHPRAQIPEYATKGAGCFDIRARLEEGEIIDVRRQIISTGLAFEIPEGYALLLFSRSGHGFKNNVRLSNCIGVIDSDYRGELKISLIRDLQEEGTELKIMNGDRIAQGMIVEIPRVIFEEVSDLSNTDRGTGGFGSTGNQ